MRLRGLGSPPEEGDFVLDGRQSVKWTLQQGRTGTTLQTGNLISVQVSLPSHHSMCVVLCTRTLFAVLPCYTVLFLLASISPFACDVSCPALINPLLQDLSPFTWHPFSSTSPHQTIRLKADGEADGIHSSYLHCVIVLDLPIIFYNLSTGHCRSVTSPGLQRSSSSLDQFSLHKPDNGSNLKGLIMSKININLQF